MRFLRYMLMLLLYAIPVLTYSQKEADTIYLHEFYNEVRLLYVSEDSESDLTEEEIDSMLMEMHTSIYNQKMHYSPDGKFMILIVEGEGCGAYCNPFWISRIVIPSKDLIFDEVDFTSIDSIHVLPDGKYLVIQSSYGRPASVYTVEGRTAHVISFENDEFVYHRIPYKYPRGGENTDPYDNGAINFEQEHFIASDIFIEYDQSQRILKYQYGRNYLFCCQEDSTFIYTGQFKYESGSFIHEFEKEEYVGTTDEHEY